NCTPERAHRLLRVLQRHCPPLVSVLSTLGRGGLNLERLAAPFRGAAELEEQTDVAAFPRLAEFLERPLVLVHANEHLAEEHSQAVRQASLVAQLREERTPRRLAHELRVDPGQRPERRAA